MATEMSNMEKLRNTFDNVEVIRKDTDPRFPVSKNRAYQVWVRGWHLHLSKNVTMSIVESGESEEDAAAKVLDIISKHKIFPTPSCRIKCPLA
ncbi:MAG: hypothetical protein R3346_04815 [Candidatus Spechtbacterales bacterium]|nr:hypothetical protein [Candidatus Spechtbacterales bacterium]